MQQAGPVVQVVVAPVARAPFQLNRAADPWDLFAVPDWQPLPETVCTRVELVIENMVQPPVDSEYDSELVPLPLVVDNPGDVPRSYFVAITRREADSGRETYSVWLNQFRMEILPGGDRVLSRTRPIMTPAHVVAKYPDTKFDHVKMSDVFLCRLFWGVLSNAWWAGVHNIIISSLPILPPVVGSGAFSKRLLFNHVRSVLHAGVMQPQPRLASLMIPSEDSDLVYMAFTRVDGVTINTVEVQFPFFGGGDMAQVEPNFARRLKQVFPKWNFPFVKLNDQELFGVVQVPVRDFFKSKVQNALHAKLLAPRLRMLAKVLIPGAVKKGCFLGNFSRDLLLRIVAIVKEDFAYP